MRLAHFIEHHRRAMLGGDLELAADVVGYKLPEEAVVLILKQVIIAYARADKDLLDLGERAHGAQDIEILGVVGLEPRARLGGKAFLALAKSPALLPSQDGRRKLAVGPPISWIYPLKSGRVVSSFASLTIDSLLRVVI